MPYSQFTQAQMRSRLQERLAGLATAFYRTDELNRVLYQSLRFFNCLTGFWKTRAIISTVANQAWYQLPQSAGQTITISAAMRVSFNGFPMSIASIIGLDAGEPYWESEGIVPGGTAATSPQVWAPGGLQIFAIWRNDITGGNSLTVDGIAATPIPASDTASVDMGEEELQIILDYAEHVCLFKQGGQEFERSMALFKSFMEGCSRRNEMLLNNAIFRDAMGTNKFNRIAVDDVKKLGAK